MHSTAQRSLLLCFLRHPGREPLAQSSACGRSAGAVTDAVAHQGIGNLSSTVMRSGATCQQEGDLTCLWGKGRGLCSPPAIQSQLDPTS